MHQRQRNPSRDASLGFDFVDLFAGLGGFHVALKNLGGNCVFAAEWEQTLNALYKQNFEMDACWGDLNELDTDTKIADVVPDHTVLTAGFPCQPFSKAGDQQGFSNTLQGRLFFKVHDVLRLKRPRFFILENVPNILKHDKGRTKDRIISDLGSLGYSVDVKHFSPHQFGIPQVRDRAYFVGSLDGLSGFAWPQPTHTITDITSVIRHDVTPTRDIPDQAMRAIDMWGDFLARSPESVKLPSFPLWSMEFGATYPYEEQTPAGVWARRPTRGFHGMNMTGSFGFPLDGLSIAEQQVRIPSHSRRISDLQFPRWKRTFITQNRQFYKANVKWINPWLQQWQPWNFHSSFQKMEWNVQGGRRDIDNYVLQVRASGIRIKRPTTSPSLIAFTQTQIPILGSHLVNGPRRYMTPTECAELQSLGGLDLPANELVAYKALGNAVNANVVKMIAGKLLDPILRSRSVAA